MRPSRQDLSHSLAESRPRGVPQKSERVLSPGELQRLRLEELLKAPAATLTGIA